MHVLVTYDVASSRVHAVCKLMRSYLFWVQRSVFEGELSPSQLQQLQAIVSRIIKPEYDSVYFYTWDNFRGRMVRQVVGRCSDERFGGAPSSQSSALVLL